MYATTNLGKVIHIIGMYLTASYIVQNLLKILIEPIHSYEDASFPAPGYLYISQCSFGPQCQPQNGIFWVISLKQFLLISWTITYTCLIPWQIQKITYSGCERHTLTLLSLYTVFSSLPWLSGMVSQLRMCSLFKQDIIKNC